MNYYNQNFNQNYPFYQQQFQPSLFGKIVDSAEMVKATDVPIGGYGVFPKGDFTEIYIKSWNQDGTSKIIIYRPYIPPEPVQQKDQMEEVLKRLDNLENLLKENGKKEKISNEY